MGVSENEVPAAQIYGSLNFTSGWKTIFADKPIFGFPSKPRGYVVFPYLYFWTLQTYTQSHWQLSAFP